MDARESAGAMSAGLAAGVGGRGGADRVCRGLLGRPEPEPLPADVGLATGADRRLRAAPDAAVSERDRAASRDAPRGQGRATTASASHAGRSRAERQPEPPDRPDRSGAPRPRRRPAAGARPARRPPAPIPHRRQRRRPAAAVRPDPEPAGRGAPPVETRPAARARPSSGSSIEPRGSMIRRSTTAARRLSLAAASRSPRLAARALAALVAARRRRRQLRGHPVQPGQPAAGQASWERRRDHYRSALAAGPPAGCRPSTTRAESGLWDYGAWVWRAPAGHRVHQRPGERQPHLPGRPPRQLIATAPAGEAVEFGAEHNDFRVHSIAGEFTQFHSLAALRRAGRRPAVRARRRRLRPRLRPRRLPAHRGPRRAHARARRRLAARRPGRPRSPRARVLGRRRRAAASARSASRPTARPSATDVRNCAARRWLRDRAQPVPGDDGRVGRGADDRGRPSPPGRTPFDACVEDLALDGAANRACEPRSVWVDNACPGSPVDGGERSRQAFARGESRDAGALRPAAPWSAAALARAPAPGRPSAR